jgi:hypothetical protein
MCELSLGTKDISVGYFRAPDSRNQMGDCRQQTTYSRQTTADGRHYLLSQMPFWLLLETESLHVGK